MIDVNYYKFFINIRNVWFPDKEISQLSNSDITIVHALNHNVMSSYSFSQKTLLTDLTMGKDQLFSLMNNNYRNEVRKSDNYNFKIDFYKSSDVLSNLRLIKIFYTEYDKFRKKINLNVKFNKKLIKEYSLNNNVVLTTIKYENHLLCQHLYIRDENKVRLLYSVSSFRSLYLDSKIIGYANKKLHWIDLLYFSEAGIKTYDWGGISSSDEPNNIDKFKIRFGGTINQNSVSFIGNSRIGKLILKIKFLKR
jgi:hypothetical protein